VTAYFNRLVRRAASSLSVEWWTY